MAQGCVIPACPESFFQYGRAIRFFVIYMKKLQKRFRTSRNDDKYAFTGKPEEPIFKTKEVILKAVLNKYKSPCCPG